MAVFVQASEDPAERLQHDPQAELLIGYGPKSRSVGAISLQIFIPGYLVPEDWVNTVCMYGRPSLKLDGYS